MQDRIIDIDHCGRKILPNNCLMFFNAYHGCPPRCACYTYGEPVDPTLYPKVKLDCKHLDRAGSSFFCLEQVLLDDEVNCLSCPAYQHKPPFLTLP
ncbi:MAG: hypothetical protein ACFFC7_20990 [Candidatus Hermodarchaeota archaeon]